jgi:uncharacterized protein (DUF2141 family)
VRSFLLAALVWIVTAPGARAGDLVVEVQDVRGPGEIFLALFNSADAWPDDDKAFREKKGPAQKGTVRIVIPDIPPGRYAIGLFHDENGNGELDKNFIGIPREGYGLSNNVRPRFSTPSFEDVAFDVPPEGCTTTIRIVY